MSTEDAPVYSPFFGVMGAASAIVFSGEFRLFAPRHLVISLARTRARSRRRRGTLSLRLRAPRPSTSLVNVAAQRRRRRRRRHDAPIRRLTPFSHAA